MTVKPLDWQRVGRSNHWHARTIGGTVSVRLDYTPDWRGVEWVLSCQFTGDGPPSGPFDSAEDAKAAANRWHAERVMEWVEPQQDRPNPIGESTVNQTPPTSGPWKWDGDEYTPTVFRDAGQTVGGSICEVDGQPTPGESAANARLIAASPDLLAALFRLAHICKFHAYLQSHPALKQAVAAIRKAAEGE